MNLPNDQKVDRLCLSASGNPSINFFCFSDVCSWTLEVSLRYVKFVWNVGRWDTNLSRWCNVVAILLICIYFFWRGTGLSRLLYSTKFKFSISYEVNDLYFIFIKNKAIKDKTNFFVNRWLVLFKWGKMKEQSSAPAVCSSLCGLRFVKA